MQLIRGSSAGRHIRNGRDRYGRFLWIDIQGKNDKKACIITAYRALDCQALKATPHTAYWQQVTAMIKDGYVDPDPRNQILKDLSN